MTAELLRQSGESDYPAIPISVVERQGSTQPAEQPVAMTNDYCVTMNAFGKQRTIATIQAKTLPDILESCFHSFPAQIQSIASLFGSPYQFGQQRSQQRRQTCERSPLTADIHSPTRSNITTKLSINLHFTKTCKYQQPRSLATPRPPPHSGSAIPTKLGGRTKNTTIAQSRPALTKPRGSG